MKKGSHEEKGSLRDSLFGLLCWPLVLCFEALPLHCSAWLW